MIPAWSDYFVTADISPLQKTRICGVGFRMENAQSHYFFGLKWNMAVFLKRTPDKVEILARRFFPYKRGVFYSLGVLVQGTSIRCSIDHRIIFDAEDSSYRSGKICLIADGPALFRNASVSLKPVADDRQIPAEPDGEERRDDRQAHLGMRLFHRIKLHNACSGRSIRFGDLTGDGRQDLVLAQGAELQPDQNSINCLTAMDLDGNILWRRGELTTRRDMLTADLPFQIYDIDGDGRNEVICAMDFELLILDGETGEVKAKAPTPEATGANPPHPRLLGDSLYFANLSGKDTPREILFKDRYSKIFALNPALEILWQYECNTGHYPFAADLNGDGRDEVLVGYTLLDPDGRKLAEIPVSDHADAVSFFKFPGSGEFVVLIAASDEGLVFADLEGQVRKHLRLGHAQTVIVARLCPSIPGYQIATNTYWGNPGVIYILNEHGKILNTFQPSFHGSPLSPVNWTGDGSHLLLLSASTGPEGGLYDGFGRQVVAFPDDGHPALCSDSLDLTGNGLDDIVCWDHDDLWIYTRDPNGLHAPAKPRLVYPPRHNTSNYRAFLMIEGPHED